METERLERFLNYFILPTGLLVNVSDVANCDANMLAPSVPAHLKDAAEDDCWERGLAGQTAQCSMNRCRAGLSVSAEASTDAGSTFTSL